MKRFSPLKLIVMILIAVFPVCGNMITHGSSVIMAILVMLGLPMVFSKHRDVPNRPVKWVVRAFYFFFMAYLASFAVNWHAGNLIDPRIKFVDHELRFLSVLPIFMLLRRLDIREGVFWVGVVCGAMVAGAYALIDVCWTVPGQRVSAAYHAIAFGDLSLALAFMSIPAKEWFNRYPRIAWAPAAAFLMGAAASALSITRGAWIAMPGLLWVLYVYWGRFMRMARRLALVAAICGLALAAYLLPQTGISERVNEVYGEVAGYMDGQRVYTAVTTRIEGWRAAWHIFRQSPVIGAGPGSYKPLLKRMIDNGIRHKIALPHSQPHSAYLAVMADCGLLGLVGLLGVLLMPLWPAVFYIRQGGRVRALGYALIMLVVAFAHFGLTETIFGRNININFYVITASVIMAVATNAMGDRQAPSGGDQRK